MTDQRQIAPSAALLGQAAHLFAKTSGTGVTARAFASEEG